LAATGKGHLTDAALHQVFDPKGKTLTIHWYPDEYKSYHPNALNLRALDEHGKLLAQQLYYSVGGGKVVVEQQHLQESRKKLYPPQFGSLAQILAHCKKEKLQLWEFVLDVEGQDIYDYMEQVWTVMVEASERGLAEEGLLPGGLKLQRKARQFYQKAAKMGNTVNSSALAIVYALAVSEENASGGKVVTAPTCGACGVVPAVLLYLQNQEKIEHTQILNALLTAALIGNLVKENGSISGAEVGCQGEVGVACSMASAAATQLLGGTIEQIEYAAEMGLEHHLGLTCDPMLGLVQIPCIERNALGAMRALDHARYALLSDGSHKVSFDTIVQVMMETGQALPPLYRETSLGGLGRILS
jgi:L-serine dehydratase